MIRDLVTHIDIPKKKNVLLQENTSKHILLLLSQKHPLPLFSMTMAQGCSCSQAKKLTFISLSNGKLSFR